MEHHVRDALRLYLTEIQESYGPGKDAFIQENASERDFYMDAIITRRDSMLSDMLARLSGGSTPWPLDLLFEEVAAYARQCDWTYIDPVILIACLDRVDDDLIDRVAQCGLAYQAFRMIDDAVDGHFDYKGAYPTLFGTLVEHPHFQGQVLTFSLLPAILMLCEGIGAATELRARTTVLMAQHTALGMLREYVPTATTFGDYASVVEDKMVSYGMLLYGPILDAVSEAYREQVRSMLKASFLLAQITNDLADLKPDHRRRQLNFWHLEDATPSPARFVELLKHFAHDVDRLPAQYRPYAATRLYDLASYAVQMLDAAPHSAAPQAAHSSLQQPPPT